MKLLKKIWTRFLKKKDNISGQNEKKDKNNYLASEEYIELNKEYVERLNFAVQKEGIYNIALMGGYGTGKSSILKQFSNSFCSDVSDKNIFYISLLHIVENNRAQNHCGKEKMINIQREIFLQMFYKFKPNELKDSSFSRIGSNASIPELAGLFFIAVSVLLIFKMDKGVIFDNHYNGSYINILIFISLVFMNIYIFSFLLSRFKIKSISFNKFVKINKKIKFLEDHKDELINIFRTRFLDRIIFWKSRTKIVIFEDLDRFNNYEIYVVLRQLNFLINQSRIVCGKVIFIYAIKDSIIQKSSNRTKLFDYILPVIPFSTSYDYKYKILAEIKSLYVGIDKDIGLYEHIIEIVNIISSYIENERVFRIFCENIRSFGLFFNNNIKSFDQILIIIIVRIFNPDVFEDFIMKRGKIVELYKDLIEMKRFIYQQYLAQIDQNTENKKFTSRQIIDIVVSQVNDDEKMRNILEEIVIEKVKNTFYFYKYLNDFGNNKNIFSKGIMDDIFSSGLVDESIMTLMSDSLKMYSAEINRFAVAYDLNIKNERVFLKESDIIEIFSIFKDGFKYGNRAIMNFSIFEFLIGIDNRKKEKNNIIEKNSEIKLNDVIKILYHKYEDEFVNFCFDFIIQNIKYGKGSNYEVLGNTFDGVLLQRLYEIEPNSIFVCMKKRKESHTLLNIWIYSGMELEYSNNINKLNADSLYELLMDNAVYKQIDIETFNKILDRIGELKKEIKFDWLVYLDDIEFESEISEMIFNKFLNSYEYIKPSYYTYLVKYGVKKQKKFPNDIVDNILKNIDNDYKETFEKYIRKAEV